MSRPLVEFVRDLLLEEFLVQVAVHLVEEVARTAVEDDVHARLDEVGHVDHGVVLPVFRMLLDGSKTLGYVPVIRERTDVHTARHAAGRAEDILMPDGTIN